MPYNKLSKTIKVRAAENDRLLQFTSSRSGTSLVLELPAGRKEPILGTDGFGIDRIEFLDLDAAGQPVSTLSGPGTIEFQHAPPLMPVHLGAGEFLNLGSLENFRVDDVTPVGLEKGLHIRMEGMAGKLGSGSKDLIEDRRPSRFDLLWRNPTLVTLFTVLGWLVPTLLAVRKYYKELQP